MFAKQKTYIDYVLILITCVVLLYSIFYNWIFVLCLTIPIVLAINKKIKILILLFYGLFSIIPIFVYLIIKDYCIFEHIPNDFIVNKLVNFVNDNYKDNTSAIILLICFGMKSNHESWIIYNETKHLSIVYLTSIGGLQISFLKLLINKVVRNKKASIIVNFIVIGFYSYVLSFRSGILRVLLCLIISSTMSRWIKNKNNRLALSGLFTIFIEPSCVFNYGFCLSYLCTFYVIWIYENKINPLLEMIFINLGCIFISIPFLAKMEGVISFNSIVFSIGFNYIFIVLFIWYIFTFYLVFLAPLHDLLANSLFLVINTIYEHNIEIKINKMLKSTEAIFYFSTFWIFNLINSYNNKKIKIN
ncbi:MAG: ComEC/Rec2 family competence protein [Mycoplasmataceae bacterium]|jgi:hypothetical protein|nr:ComEC/Rec2 family competence protein [Mycoplasmataceae bacterium]